RIRRGLAEDDEGIARDHLAVEYAGAVEAGGLDALDVTHQLGHRRCARDSQVNADRLAHGSLTRLAWHAAQASRLARPGSRPLMYAVAAALGGTTGRGSNV